MYDCTAVSVSAQCYHFWLLALLCSELLCFTSLPHMMITILTVRGCVKCILHNAGNAVEWAVRRLDASLDEAELEPPPGAKAIIDVARGPVGSATVQGVTAAARVTVQVGTTALKASISCCIFFLTLSSCHG